MAGQGRVYRVTSSQRWELLFDFEESHAHTLATHGGQLAFVGTGNAGVAYLISGQPAARGEYTSEVFDAKFLTSWGNASGIGSAGVTMVTRSGNTALPDATWSVWSESLTESPAKVASPRGRYLQARLTLTDGAAAHVKSFQVHYLVLNQKPIVTSLRVDGADKKPAKPRLPDSKTDDDEETTDETPAPKSAPKPASTVKQLMWQATDKDGDKLVYRLFYRAWGDEQWIAVPLDKPLAKTSHAWETDSIPDGWYRLKVVASDEESNPVGAALTDEKISDLVKVDNRRPDVADLNFAAGAVTGVARDNLSLIVTLEYSVNGGDWKPFAPADGIFDAPSEPFTVTIPDLPAPPSTIAVRATDEQGNIGVEQIVVK